MFTIMLGPRPFYVSVFHILPRVFSFLSTSTVITTVGAMLTMKTTPFARTDWVSPG